LQATPPSVVPGEPGQELNRNQQQQQQQQHGPVSSYTAEELPKIRRALQQLGPNQEFSPLLTPLDIIVHGGWDTLGKTAVMGAVAARAGVALAAAAHDDVKTKPKKSRARVTTRQADPGSSSAGSPTTDSPSSSSSSSPTNALGVVNTATGIASDALAAGSNPASNIGRAASSIPNRIASAANPAALGNAVGSTAPTARSGTAAAQQAALESGSLSAMQGLGGLDLGSELSGISPWVSVLQTAAMSDVTPSLAGSNPWLSMLQSAAGASSGLDLTGGNNPVWAALQGALGNGITSSIAGSSPWLTLLQGAMQGGSSSSPGPISSSTVLSALQQGVAGSSKGTSAAGSDALVAALQQSALGVSNPLLGLLQQGALGGSGIGELAGSIPWASVLQGALSAAGSTGITTGSNPLLSALQGAMGGSMPLHSAVQQNVLGRRHMRKLSGVDDIPLSYAYQVPAGSGGSTYMYLQQGAGSSGSSMSRAAMPAASNDVLLEQGHADLIKRLQYLPHYNQQPWPHKAAQAIQQNIHQNMPRDGKQTVHDIYNMVQPVKQTAGETKNSIVFDSLRSAIEAKRVDDSIKGQMVDNLSDALSRTQLKQQHDWKGIAQPWADAAQDIMQTKAKHANDFANDLADTDLQFGGEIEVIVGSAANATRNGMFNMTGASKNLANAVTGGARNYYNETRYATRSFANAIPGIVNSTTQTALNTITSVAPAIAHAGNTVQQVANTAAKFPRDIGSDAGKLVSAGVGAAPLMALSLGTGVASVVPTVVPWVSHGVDLAASAGLGVLNATGTVMHNTVVPMAQGALQSSGSLGTNLLTVGFNQGFNEGLMSSLERRKPYQDGPRESARVADQPALFLPSSFAPMGQMMTVTYPCPTGNFPGPVGPAVPVPGVPPQPIPGQPPGAAGPVAAGPPTAPVGTIIGPGIPCGVLLYMVPKHAVPKQTKPRPQPLVEFPVDPPVSSGADAFDRHQLC